MRRSRHLKLFRKKKHRVDWMHYSSNHRDMHSINNPSGTQSAQDMPFPSVCCLLIVYVVAHIRGFISSCHNEVRRIAADLLKGVCIDVEEEPLLQEVTGESSKAKTAKIEKNARLNIAARGFWMRGQQVSCDVQAFNPIAKCHRSKPLADVHQTNRKKMKV